MFQKIIFNWSLFFGSNERALYFLSVSLCFFLSTLRSFNGTQSNSHQRRSPGQLALYHVAIRNCSWRSIKLKNGQTRQMHSASSPFQGSPVASVWRSISLSLILDQGKRTTRAIPLTRGRIILLVNCFAGSQCVVGRGHAKNLKERRFTVTCALNLPNCISVWRVPPGT